MPSRRSHTKSRKGCLQCKRRHVKCDEELPKCSLCKKRKLDCTYPPASSDADSQHPSTPQGDFADPAPGSDVFPLQTRMLEMKLFHHYLIETSPTLRQDTLDVDHFQIVVPRLATSNPFLLDIILAFSALHLAFLEQDDSKWLEVALKYQNRACSAFSKILAEFSPENSGPAFICSIFIMLCTTAYPCVSQDKDKFDPLSQVLEIRRLIAGCAFLFQQLDSMEQPGELEGWLVYKQQEELEQNGGVAEKIHKDSNLEKLQSELLKSLHNVHTTIDRTQGPHRATYLETWNILHEMARRWPMGSTNGGVLAWPIHISETFISLLKAGDWMARIIFLHYGVGMHLLSDKWFVGAWGRRLVSAVLQPLDQIPSDWKETVEWARKAVETEW